MAWSLRFSTTVASTALALWLPIVALPTRVSAQLCDCSEAWSAAKLAKFRSGIPIEGSIVTNNPGGLVRFARDARMLTGSITADRVIIASGQVNDVVTNEFKAGADATIGGTVTEGGLILPVIDPFCELPAMGCGGPSVTVPATETDNLAPGTYGDLIVGHHARLVLTDEGTYSFCNVSIEDNAFVGDNLNGLQVTVNVVGDLRVRGGIGDTVFYAGPSLVLNVQGRVKLSGGASLGVALRAPNAIVKLKRGAKIIGCSCSVALKARDSFLQCSDAW
jgi:hypothetical protein